MFFKIFEKIDSKYSFIKELIHKKKLFDAYLILKDNEDEDSIFLRAVILYLLKKWQKFRLELSKLKEIKYIEKDFFLELKANSFFEEKNYTEALKLYLKSLEINPSNFYSKYNISNIYILKKDYKNAYKILKELLDEEPENITIKNNLNLLKEKLQKV